MATDAMHDTVDREIFAAKIKQAKYFLRRVIRIGLVPRVVLSTKIKRCENFTSENFPIYGICSYYIDYSCTGPVAKKPKLLGMCVYPYI